MDHVIIPNKFILIIDKDGDAVDVESENTTVDMIFTYLRIYDNEFKNDAPHSAWKYDGSDFYLIEDACHLPNSNFKSARSIKLDNKNKELKELGYEEPTDEERARGNFGSF